ncbi:MAG: prepilin-type N-terminal cleavage/methylation domain-containing protein [Bifidobacteriaceae bacterium]|jgi:prepilin-type N-terminal cleavage/methylation domain-containing protein|nr:prepilin-type N-terminal cleavage/methylation domain-containing protein [Bifidobacteriaceae bacterium]
MASVTVRGNRGQDRGFSLVELLIVVIIIGVLAAIAIPLFLSQRAKAQDAQTLNDVTVIGQELSAYWTEENAAAPTIRLEDGPVAGERTWHLLPNGVSAVTTANYLETLLDAASPNVALGLSGNTDHGLYQNAGTNRYDWCFWAYNPRGKEKGYWITPTTDAQGTGGSSTVPAACEPAP